MVTIERRYTFLVFVAALSLYTLTAGGSLSSTDAVVSFDLTRSIVERHSIALSGDLLGSSGNQGLDGRFYSQFGIGHAIYNIPFYLAGRAAAALAGRQIGKPDTVPKAAVALGSAVAAAIAATLVWLLSFRLTGDARSALLACASAAIGSPLWTYSKFGFSTALTTAILMGAVCCCWTAAARGSVRAAWVGGAVVAFGWLTRHEMALVLLPFSLFLWIEGRRRRTSSRQIAHQTAAFLLSAGMGGVLWMIYNVVRFGHPADVGYVPVFSGEGYAAFLVAPGGAVLLFCPMAILWLTALVKVRSTMPGVVVLLAGPLLVAYLFYGALADWPGGRSYGPRYLVPSLTLLAPALSLALQSREIRRGTAIGAIVLAAVLQLPGVLVDYSKVSLDWARGATRQQVAARNWWLASSPFVLNTEAAAGALPDNVAYLTGRKPMPLPSTTGDGRDREFAQQFAFSLDFWWLYLVYLRVIGPIAGLAAAGALALVAAGAAFVAWRQAPTGNGPGTRPADRILRDAGVI
jgi:Dolichyl-phosphate-mannose-protein mannosyltransferase